MIRVSGMKWILKICVSFAVKYIYYSLCSTKQTEWSLFQAYINILLSIYQIILKTELFEDLKLINKSIKDQSGWIQWMENLLEAKVNLLILLWNDSNFCQRTKFHSSARNYKWNLGRTSNSSQSTRPVGQALWEKLL